MMEIDDRELRKQVYIRVCRDSQFRLDWLNAAFLAAKMAKCHPIDIWLAVGDFSLMERIARGEHAVVVRELSGQHQATGG